MLFCPISFYLSYIMQLVFLISFFGDYRDPADINVARPQFFGEKIKVAVLDLSGQNLVSDVDYSRCFCSRHRINYITQSRCVTDRPNNTIGLTKCKQPSLVKLYVMEENSDLVRKW